MLQMNRQPTGRDQRGIDADIVAGLGIARDEDLGRRHHPDQPLTVEREGERGGVAAGLYLDEGDKAGGAGHEVHPAGRRADAFGEDGPALLAEEGGGNRFGLPACRPSASAA